MKSNQNTKPKIEDEKHFNFDDDKDRPKNSSYEQLCDNYYANHVNINCYKYTEKLYDSFLQAFSYLPIGAIVNKTSLCIHGGLSPHFERVDHINSQIQRPINEFEENGLLSDILWGDPSDTLKQSYSDNQRGRGQIFNGPVVVNFLKNNNLKRLVRGHECVMNGVQCLFNDKCITVFSASSYSSNMGNKSGVLKLYQKNDTFECVSFKPLPRLKKCDTNYYKVQAFNSNENSSPHHSIISHSVSDYKSGFLSNWVHISATHSETSLPYHHFMQHSNSCNCNCACCNCFGDKDIHHEQGSHHQKQHLFRFSSLRSGPRKKIISCSGSTICNPLNQPVIFTPHMSRQNSDFTSISNHKSESS